jgi:hypothetical protein
VILLHDASMLNICLGLPPLATLRAHAGTNIYLQIDRIGPKPTFNTKVCGKVRLDVHVLIGPLRALTFGGTYTR